MNIDRPAVIGIYSTEFRRKGNFAAGGNKNPKILKSVEYISFE